ncbi:LysR family transcriptional regulator [Clostridium kluyveri]|nr:LysR family transcriptional regulator [Clostridium kluyveri]
MLPLGGGMEINMTLLQLKYFISVAETGNFTHAAEQVYTSQPTISRHIQLLEDELGYALFNRNSKPIRLTEPGQILYEGVKAAISEINYTLNMAKIASEGKIGSLSISFQSGYYSEYMFFPIINELRETWSSLQIRCNKLFSWEQIKGLKNESIDIAIGLDFPHWDKSGFTVIPLKEVETLIVMSTHHRLANKQTLDYNDLCGETFFLTAPNGYQVDKIFKDRFDLTNVHQVEVASSEVAYFKVLSYNGLTISNPYDPILLNSPHYHSIKFDSEYSDSYVCVVNPNNANPVIKLFLDLINRYCIGTEK